MGSCFSRPHRTEIRRLTLLWNGGVAKRQHAVSWGQIIYGHYGACSIHTPYTQLEVMTLIRSGDLYSRLRVPSTLFDGVVIRTSQYACMRVTGPELAGIYPRMPVVPISVSLALTCRYVGIDAIKVAEQYVQHNRHRFAHSRKPIHLVTSVYSSEVTFEFDNSDDARWAIQWRPDIFYMREDNPCDVSTYVPMNMAFTTYKLDQDPFELKFPDTISSVS